MSLLARVRSAATPLLNRLLRRTSATYRMMQREQAASIARQQGRTGNVWSDLYRGAGKEEG